MTLRDALAAALDKTGACDRPALRYHNAVCGHPSFTTDTGWAAYTSDRLLSDSAFREALTAAVAEAMADEDWSEAGWSTADGWDDLAAAIVARMLGEAA